MNNVQKTFLLVGVFTIVLMGLYPPWQRVEPGEGPHSMGYSYLWKPPVQRRSEHANLFGIKIDIGLEPITANAIDWSRLLTQCGVVAVATFGLIVLFRQGSQQTGSGGSGFAEKDDERSRETATTH